MNESGAGVRGRVRAWTSRLGAPQSSAAVLVLLVGVLLNVEPLVLALVDGAGPGELAVSAVAVALLLLAYGQVTWPLVYGGLGQRRLVLRALAYAFGVAVLCVAQGREWFDVAFIALSFLAVCLPRPAAVAGGTGFVALVVWAVLRDGADVTVAVDTALHTVLLAAVFAVLLWASTMLRYVEAGRQAAEQSAIVEERLRMGRDLHDVVVHHFTAIGLKAEIAERIFPTDPDRALREVREIEETTAQGLSRVRSLVHGYRHSGFTRTLAQVTNVLETAGVAVTTDVEAAAGSLPEASEQALCWVLTESATNALRHSSPTVVAVQLRTEPEGATLRITNDGVLPVSGVHRRGHGLAGLAERLQAVHGSISSVRTPDGSFTVSATVPGGSGR